MHMKVGGGDDNEGKILESGERQTDDGILLHFAFTSEKKFDTVSLRKGLCFGYMREILRLVPIASSLHRAVPIVVGEDYLGKTVFLRVSENSYSRLLRIVRAGGEL